MVYDYKNILYFHSFSLMEVNVHLNIRHGSTW